MVRPVTAMKYVYLLRVTFEAPDDVAAKESLATAADGGTTDRVRKALLRAVSADGVSEKLQRVKDGDQPRLVRRYR